MVFGKLGVFVKRCGKLVEMLSTIGQFEELAKNKHIDGMDALVKKFFKTCEEFKRKPYDLLDYQQNQFDRDFLDFNVMVHDVETSLQEFISKVLREHHQHGGVASSAEPVPGHHAPRRAEARPGRQVQR